MLWYSDDMYLDVHFHVHVTGDFCALDFSYCTGKASIKHSSGKATVDIDSDASGHLNIKTDDVDFDPGDVKVTLNDHSWLQKILNSKLSTVL